MDPHEKNVEKIIAALENGEISENEAAGQIDYALSIPMRPSTEIRVIFDKHQETCERCGLGNVPPLCKPARRIRDVYLEAKKLEDAA